MKVTIYEGRNRRDIEEYVEKSDSVNLYHDPRWVDVIKESFAHTTYYLSTMDERGKVTGVLPLTHLKSFLFGNFLVSMPYFNYGGISSEDESARSLLLEESIRIARDLNAEYIEFRQTGQFPDGFPVKTGKVSMRLELPSYTEDLWKSFPSKLRSQVRRPMKEGMEARVGREEELDSFYHVFSINMRDLGTPVYPKHFFRNILKAFPGRSWITTVYREKEAVASGFLVAFKKTIEIPWASSIRRYNRLSPNMLLYWKCLSFACEEGFEYFDFGRSTRGEGTYRFKEQWGAVPRQLYWYYWLKEGRTLPDVSPDNPKYRLAIKGWKKLPLAVTKVIGPQIVKYIP